MRFNFLIFIFTFSSLFPQELGRDKDPKTASDITKGQLFYRKAVWSMLSLPGQRFMASLLFPKSSISHMNANKTVAFTIDDGFCGIDNPQGCMINEVMELLKKYDAHATFFITGSHCKNVKPKDVQNLLKDGHELANHGMYDYPYNNHSKEEFIEDLNQTYSIISKYTDKKLKWYRAPHAKLSNEMQEVLDSLNMVHVISDAFANDTAIPDPKWISETIIDQVKEGSIIVMHMPEKGVREWCLDAMELTLDHISRNLGYDIVNLTELEKRSIKIK